MWRQAEQVYLAGQHRSGRENLSLMPLSWPDTCLFPTPPRQEARGQDQHGSRGARQATLEGSCCPLRDYLHAVTLCVPPSLGAPRSGLAARLEQIQTTEQPQDEKKEHSPMHSPQKQVCHFQKNWKEKARDVIDGRAQPHHLIKTCKLMLSFHPEIRGEPRGGGGLSQIKHESPFKRTAALT